MGVGVGAVWELESQAEGWRTVVPRLQCGSKKKVVVGRAERKTYPERRCTPPPPSPWQGAHEQVKENVQGKMHSASERVQVGAAAPASAVWRG